VALTLWAASLRLAIASSRTESSLVPPEVYPPFVNFPLPTAGVEDMGSCDATNLDAGLVPCLTCFLLLGRGRCRYSPG
jgi:hypothetical protein